MEKQFQADVRKGTEKGEDLYIYIYTYPIPVSLFTITMCFCNVYALIYDLKMHLSVCLSVCHIHSLFVIHLIATVGMYLPKQNGEET